MAYFPLFIELNNKSCLVVGGGKIAYDKVKVLLDFDASVIVVASDICSQIENLSKDTFGKITLIKRRFESQDVKNMALVVAATDDHELNRTIADICRKEGTLVNAVDQKEKCDFIFPSYIKQKNIVAAVSSGGNSPLITQEIRDEISGILTPEVGVINEEMGRIREYVSKSVLDMDTRKAVYKTIYIESKNIGRMISDERIQEIIDNAL